MKEDKLHKAISELPVFEAPDVWPEIENSINSNRDGKMFLLALFLMIVCGTCLMLTNFLNGEVTVKSETVSVEIEMIAEVVLPGDKTINDLNISNEASISVIEKDKKSDFQQQMENISFVSDKVQKYDKLEIADSSNYIEIIRKMIYVDELIIRDIGDNLVNNPSFEEFSVCPKGIVGNPERKLIPYWEVPSKGTPDYFNSCSKQDAGVPHNFAGSIKAHSGQGYCGMILRQNFTQDNKITGEKPKIYREYIQTELKSELVAGRKYRISFWVCNSSKSRYAVDAIGASIDKERTRASNTEVLNLVPNVENTIGKFLSNQNYWVKIEGIYEASGGEKFLTIGNFNNNTATNYIMQNGNTDFNYAYYYIDDVSVLEIEEVLQTRLLEDSGNDNRNTFVAEF